MRPIYRAESVIEIKSDQNLSRSSSIGSQEGLSSLEPLLNIDLGSTRKTSLPAEFTGTQFLLKVLNSGDLGTNIKESCDERADGFSIGYLLRIAGLRDKARLTEEQKNTVYLKCLRKQITIGKFEINRMKSGAQLISFEDFDPIFVARALNKIIELYFEEKIIEGEKKHKEKISYLSKIESELQYEIYQAKKKLDDFLVINPSYGLISNLEGTSNLEDTKKSKVISELKNLREQKQEIDSNINFLEESLELADIDHTKILEETSKNTATSKFFVGKLRSLDNENDIRSKASRLRSAIFQEISRLRSLNENIQAISQEKEKTLSNVLKVEEEYEKLQLEFLSKKNSNEAMRFLIRNETVQSGLNFLTKNIVHSKAIIPLSPIRPNLLFILASFFASFLSLTIVALYVWQVLYPKVLSFDQLGEDLKKLPLLLLTKKVSNNRSLLNQGFSNMNNELHFVSETISSGKKGVLVELGNRDFFGLSRSVSEATALFISSVALVLGKVPSLNGLSGKGEILFNKLIAQHLTDDFKLGKTTREENVGKDLEKSKTAYRFKQEYHFSITFSGQRNNFTKNLLDVSDCDFFLLVVKIDNINSKKLSNDYMYLSKFHNKCAGLVLVE